MRLRLMMFLLTAFLFLGAQAMAQPGQEARAVLEKTIATILDDIRSPQFANSATRDAVIAKMENEVKHVFDFGEFSSRTVGPRWKTFSDAQKAAFSNAFADLLFTTYLNKITGYNGETVAYTGETVSQDGKRVEVKTVITMSDGKKTPVSYRMLPKDGSWRVYDVIIENISLVKNYRTQFASILQSASPEELVEKINARARELAAQGTGNAK